MNRVTAAMQNPLAKKGGLTAALAAMMLPALASADGPTRDDFYREMLTPGPTALTSEFNSYYEDAYTVDKLELLESFSSFAHKEGQRVRALVVIGPLGPLWTYTRSTISAQLPEKDLGDFRFNVLVADSSRLHPSCESGRSRELLIEALQRRSSVL